MSKQYDKNDNDPLVSVAGLKAYTKKVKDTMATQVSVDSLETRVNDLDANFQELIKLLDKLTTDLESIA